MKEPVPTSLRRRSRGLEWASLMPKDHAEMHVVGLNRRPGQGRWSGEAEENHVPVDFKRCVRAVVPQTRTCSPQNEAKHLQHCL